MSTLSRVFVALCLTLAAFPASAQVTTGAITGRVTDPEGAAVPGATVEASNDATGFVRATTSGTSGLRFSRGDDALSFACSDVNLTQFVWERVDFGTRARVQEIVVPLNNSSFSVTIGSVDPTRTLVFAGGQVAGGQATGETSLNNSGDDTIGPAMARFKNPFRLLNGPAG